MSRIAAIAFLIFLFGAINSRAQLPVAPSWQTGSELPNVDWGGLTGAPKSAALKLMRQTGCTCGCGMKVAQCRVEDPPCGYSKALAGLIVKGFKDGKSSEEVAKLVAASAVGQPRQAPKLLEDPIDIPTAGSPVIGPASAKITLVEFSDFECPYCSQATVQVHQILAAYPKDVRLIYKQFPLSMHPHANLASLASLAAYDQGKFWEMHDELFANFRQLSRDNMLAWAKKLGLDMDKFKAGLESEKHKVTVQKDLQDGEYAGVSGTPSFFINGKKYNGQMTLASIKPIFDAELKAAAGK